MDAMNQQYDRITQLLQERSGQNYYPPEGQQIEAMTGNALANVYAGNGPGNLANDIAAMKQQNVDRPVNDAMAMLKVFEAKKASGDKQAQALDERIKMFTGGDPEGTALILNELHADPEEIDPSNSYQTMTKIAGIVKKNGYQSPTLMLDKQKAQMDLLKTESEINKNNAAANKDSYEISGTNSPAEKAMQVKRDALTVVDRLLNNQSGVKANRGGISTFFPNISDASVNAEGDLDTLASLLTTENLGLLKGVLSDTDMKILKDIGAGGLKGADAQVLQNLQILKQKLSGQTGADNPPLITSKSAYDALPSGAVYTEDDGKTYRKP